MTRFKFQILLGIMAYALSLGCSTTGQPENTIQAVASAMDCIVILPRETNGKHIPEPVIAEEVKSVCVFEICWSLRISGQTNCSRNRFDHHQI